MRKKNTVLKEYYNPLRENDTFKQRFLSFCKIHNIFGVFNSDKECLELAEKVLNSFSPNQTIDKDIFLQRVRLALVNTIVFNLYYKRTPEDWDFIRIIQLLEKTKEEAKDVAFNYEPVRPYSLSLLYANENTKEPAHTGYDELELFCYAPGGAAYIVVDDVLRNLESPAVCQRLFRKFLYDKK